jgi:hypothetical protein
MLPVAPDVSREPPAASTSFWRVWGSGLKSRAPESNSQLSWSLPPPEAAPAIKRNHCVLTVTSRLTQHRCVFQQWLSASQTADHLSRVLTDMLIRDLLIQLLFILFERSISDNYGIPVLRGRESGSSVSIVSGYGLDNRAIEVRSPAQEKGFFL